jgi:Uncharacterized protein containing LysM domain
MGIFNFIKEAGEKLWGSSSAHNRAEQSEKLQEYIQKLNIPGAENVVIQVSDSGEATVTGEALTPEEKDKILVAVGNVAGISGVNDAITTPSSSVQNDYYTVKSGDTLSAISKHMYGTPDNWQQIFDANKPMLTHPDKIYPGQMLIIPRK